MCSDTPLLPPAPASPFPFSSRGGEKKGKKAAQSAAAARSAKALEKHMNRADEKKGGAGDLGPVVYELRTTRHISSDRV